MTGSRAALFSVTPSQWPLSPGISKGEGYVLESYSLMSPECTFFIAKCAAIKMAGRPLGEGEGGQISLLIFFICEMGVIMSG